MLKCKSCTLSTCYYDYYSTHCEGGTIHITNNTVRFQEVKEVE